MGEETMTEKEQVVALIDLYADLQRIKTAPDRDAEIAYQLKIASAKLQALGISTEGFDAIYPV